MNFVDLFFFCPIPEDQKPITEYLELKQNSFNNWVTRSSKTYFNSLFFIFFLTLILFSIISFPFINSFHLLDLFSFSTKFFFLLFLIFFSIILFPFFRWLELNKRLKKARLFYEEGSWYDGKIWNKPFSLIKNEKLLAFQKIEPILQRLLRTLFSVFFLVIFFFFFFFINR